MAERRGLPVPALALLLGAGALGLFFGMGWEARVLSGFAMLHALGRYFLAFAMPAAARVLAGRAQPGGRGLAAGLLVSLGGAAELLAPAFGAWLLARLPWPAFFLVPAGGAALVGVLVSRLKDGEAPRPRGAGESLLSNRELHWLAAAEFALGFVRWGLLGWLAAFLVEVQRTRPGEPGHGAALIAAALGAVLGPVAAGLFSDAPCGGRRGVPAAAFAGLLALALAGLGRSDGPESAALWLGLACAGAFGAHALLAGAWALDLGAAGAAGTAAGLLEGAHWAGAGFSGPAVAAALDAGGWGAWTSFLLPFALAAAAFAGLSRRLGRKPS